MFLTIKNLIKKRNLFLILLLLVLLTLPLPLSFLLKKISQLSLFPDFNIAEFYESYYKSFGTLISVSFGFFLANYLIEKKQKHDEKSEIELFEMFLDSLSKHLKMIYENDDEYRIKNAKVLKRHFEYIIEQLKTINTSSKYIKYNLPLYLRTELTRLLNQDPYDKQNPINTFKISTVKEMHQKATNLLDRLKKEL